MLATVAASMTLRWVRGPARRVVMGFSILTFAAAIGLAIYLAL